MEKILIIDDHPTQIDGYRAILSLLERSISITVALTAQEAFRIITDPATKPFDLVMLDWSLPEYAKENIFNGEDLGLLIRKYMPKTKIMLITSHFNSFLLFDLTINLEPDGFLVKSDFGGSELLVAFETVMGGGVFYSDSVVKSLRKVSAHAEDLDAINRKIITMLSKGFKTKSLTEYIPLAQSTIEKRKSHIKDYLGLSSRSDEDIVMEARRKGYI